MSIYDFTVKDNEQNEVSLSEYKGKVLLIVNTATKCGLTPQYEGLEKLYKEFKERGLEILDFPCNQFLSQAPGTDEEINSFCSLNFGTTFKRFSKIDVNGENAHPLYKYLKDENKKEVEDNESKGLLQKLADLGQKVTGTEIKWNFTKFLVDREGNVVHRFAPTTKPENISKEIEKLL